MRESRVHILSGRTDLSRWEVRQEEEQPYTGRRWPVVRRVYQMASSVAQSTVSPFKGDIIGQTAAFQNSSYSSDSQGPRTKLVLETDSFIDWFLCLFIVRAHIWRSENSFQGLVFHILGSGEESQIINLGSKHLYLLSYLISPRREVL